MGPPATDERRETQVDAPRGDPWWRGVRPGKSLVLFPVAVAGVWGIFVGLLGTGARLTTAGDERPSWGEVALSTMWNVVGMLSVALLFSLGFRLVQRRRATVPDLAEVGDAPTSWLYRTSDLRLGGRLVMPTTVEGRVSLVIALCALIPFFAGPAMIGTALFLVLALRRGDRGLLLIVPGLVTLFFVVFIAMEFAVGHD